MQKGTQNMTVGSVRRAIVSFAMPIFLSQLFQHNKAIKILMDNREKLNELTEFLYDRETITGEEFMQILNG